MGATKWRVQVWSMFRTVSSLIDETELIHPANDLSPISVVVQPPGTLWTTLTSSVGIDTPG